MCLRSFRRLLCFDDSQITDYRLTKNKLVGKMKNLIKIAPSSAKSNYFCAQHFPHEENVKTKTSGGLGNFFPSNHIFIFTFQS